MKYLHTFINKILFINLNKDLKIQINKITKFKYIY